jgi:peptide/nickel transport system permease protein
MLRYAIRRALWAIPTLFAISIVVFLLASLVPEPPEPQGKARAELVLHDPRGFDAIEEARRERFLDVPRFFNTTPRDVRTVVDECVTHLVQDDEEAPVAAHRLEEVGGAAFPYLLPMLDNFPPDARGRIAMALRPVAERMGLGDDPLLGTQQSAALFWSRLWEDRSVEFTHPNVRRAVSRLLMHGSDVRDRDLMALDTFVVEDVMATLVDAEDPEGQARLIAVLAHVTNRPLTLPKTIDAATMKDVVAEWQRWWFLHRSDYVVLDGVERVAAAISETRYGKWLLSAARGQLGISSQDGQPIAAKIGARAGITLELTLASMLLSYALAIPIGVISAWRRGRSVDLGLALLMFVLYSLPTYVFAELLLQAGSSGIVWPILAMTLGSLASLSRYQRAAMLDVLRQDYVRTARGKGMSAARVLIVHALRNAMMPTLSLAGLQLPTLFGSAIVVEEVFHLPGLGYETMRAVESDDGAWLIAVVLLFAIATTIGLLATDVAYGVLDPRLRERLVKTEIT